MSLIFSGLYKEALSCWTHASRWSFAKKEAGRSRRGASAKTARRAASAAKKNRAQGLTVPRVFSTAGVNPFDAVEWEQRKAVITDDKGKTIFEQDNVEVPKSWSMLATNVVASKYFYGELEHARARAFASRQLVHRVARTIADWGLADGYFATRRRTPRTSTTNWPGCA